MPWCPLLPSFPFEEPPTPPDLSEGFDLREYLETRLPPLLRHQEPQRPQPNIHSSQIPERSRIGETNLPPQQQSSVLPLSQDLRSSPPRSARQNQTAYRGIVMRTPPTPSSPPVLVAETEPMRPIIKNYVLFTLILVCKIFYFCRVDNGLYLFTNINLAMLFSLFLELSIFSWYTSCLSCINFTIRAVFD